MVEITLLVGNEESFEFSVLVRFVIVHLFQPVSNVPFDVWGVLAILLAVLPYGVTSMVSPSGSGSDTLKVMSYNVRYDAAQDTGRIAWSHRRDKVASVIRFHGPDVVGTQEGKLHQLYDLEARLPGYEWIGVGRDNGGDEFSAIFYSVDRLQLLDHHTYWLSPTPTEPGSVGWDAALPRVVTWARFQDRTTGDSLLVVNTHFDHEGAEARHQSAQLIMERLPNWAQGAQVILMGDLNAAVGSPPYETFVENSSDTPIPLRDAKEATEQPHHGPTSTFNQFQRSVIAGRRIDYILVGPGVSVRRHGHLNEQWDEAYPSDHLPVLAELHLDSDSDS